MSFIEKSIELVSSFFIKKGDFMSETSVRYSIDETKEAIKQNFAEQLDLYSANLEGMSKKELKNELLKLEHSFLTTSNLIDFNMSILVQVVYRKKFKREIILKGANYEKSK